MVVAGVAVAACSSGTDTSVKGAAVTRPSTTVAPTTVLGPTPTTTATSGPTSTTAPGTITVPVAKAQEPVAVHKIEPHRAEYRDGKLYLVGDVPTRKLADEFVVKAALVIGPTNVVDDYRIDPAAPATSDGRVIIDEPLLFPTNSATLSTQYASLVQLGVAVMKLNPKVKMRVTGYTDDVGSDDANLLLSIARANSVVSAISAFGISRSRFIPQGKGEGDPVADNSSPEGRTLNRRIEVELLDLLG